MFILIVGLYHFKQCEKPKSFDEDKLQISQFSPPHMKFSLDAEAPGHMTT